VALELVIDVSGSMSEGPPGATKIELARQAALGAVQQLDNQDQIGILAFDDQNHWIYPMQALADRPIVESAIGRLEPGGGTEIYPALEAAYNDIAPRQAKIKHILLMTDGLAPTGDYEGLTAKMRAQGITLSTIAIGTDADQNLLQNLADWGRGRFYDATNPLDLPQFVIKETTEIARAAITEETLVPAVQDQTPILDSLTGLPPLYGYVATTPKPSATVGLVSPAEHDPILAQWQYGLGRSIAFTSDASARWSSSWVSWASFSQFWGQVFKWAVPPPQSQSLQVQTSVVAGQATIVVDAIGTDGRYVNDATTTATIAGPPGPTPDPNQPRTPPSVPLVQSAPGRYEVQVPAEVQGNYLVQVSQTAPGQKATASQVGSFTIPYSPEYAGLPPDLGLLRELGRRTGGAFLSRPADSFAHDLHLADAAQPVWPYPIAALVPLFLLDVAVRRLRLGRSDLQPAFAWLRVRWQGKSGEAATLARRLAVARQTAQPAAPRPTLRPAPAAARATLPPPPRPAPVRPAVSASGPPSSRLLAAKRRAEPAARAQRR
jgi:hypothetical protein